MAAPSTRPRVIHTFGLRLYQQTFGDTIGPLVGIEASDDQVEHILSGYNLTTCAKSPERNVVIERIERLPDYVLKVTVSARSPTTRDYLINTVLRLPVAHTVDADITAVLVDLPD